MRRVFASHTPGPWRIDYDADKNDGASLLLGPGRERIAEMLSVNDADDALIVAAPDLLAVAERVNATLLDLCRGYGIGLEGEAWIVATVEQARAAIVKATGQAPS